MTEEMKNELKKMHAYLLENGMDPQQLFKIFVRGSSQGVDTLGEIDYSTMNVTFNSPIDSDIVLDVFINRAVYDRLQDMMKKDTFFGNQFAIGTLIVQAYDEELDEIVDEKVRVYKFKDEAEMESNDIMKSLRVYTLYGVGYVGLVQEGNPNASNFKVCLGQDKYGNDIIRCLEKVN